jgi:hypothetical protein
MAAQIVTYLTAIPHHSRLRLLMAIFKISKLDAARRQLETAIRLYFSEADPVSIHTLMSAAYQVLMDLNRIQHGSPMIKDAIPMWVRPDATKEARAKLNEAANFFKHADHDHNDILEFSLEPTELLMYDAVRKYREITRIAAGDGSL